jgi:hypothetical protein
MCFVEGGQFVGNIGSMTPPKLTRKVEEWLGGGMAAPIELQYDLELMTAEWMVKGYAVEPFQQMGLIGVAGVGLRFVGAYQRDDDGGVDSVEYIMRGFHKEVDGGELKKGEAGETKVSSSLSYYRHELNGAEIVMVDAINGIERIMGVDRRAAVRAALGI